MAATRLFLDWDRHALPAAVDWLAERHARDGVLDLSEQLLVLPGSRAGRRLLELLVDHAHDSDERSRIRHNSAVHIQLSKSG